MRAFSARQASGSMPVACQTLSPKHHRSPKPCRSSTPDEQAYLKTMPQPFTAPAAMPRTNHRPETKYTTSGTIEASSVAAMLTL